MSSYKTKFPQMRRLKLWKDGHERERERSMLVGGRGLQGCSNHGDQVNVKDIPCASGATLSLSETGTRDRKYYRNRDKIVPLFFKNFQRRLQSLLLIQRGYSSSCNEKIQLTDIVETYSEKSSCSIPRINNNMKPINWLL